MNISGTHGNRNPEPRATAVQIFRVGLACIIAACLVTFPVMGATNASCCCNLYNISCCAVTTPEVTLSPNGTGNVSTYERKHTITGEGYSYVESSISGFGVNWKFISDTEAFDRLNQSATYRIYGPGTYKGLYAESGKGELVTSGEKTKAGLGTTGGGEIYLNLSSPGGKKPAVVIDPASGAQSLSQPTMLTIVVAPRDPNILQFAYCSPVHCLR